MNWYIKPQPWTRSMDHCAHWEEVILVCETSYWRYGFYGIEDGFQGCYSSSTSTDLADKPKGTGLYRLAYSLMVRFKDLSISRCRGTGADGGKSSRSVQLLDVPYYEESNTDHCYYLLMRTRFS